MLKLSKLLTTPTAQLGRAGRFVVFQIKHVLDYTKRENTEAYWIPAHIPNVPVVDWITQLTKCFLHLVHTVSTASAFDERGIGIQRGPPNLSFEVDDILKFGTCNHQSAVMVIGLSIETLPEIVRQIEIAAACIAPLFQHPLSRS